MIILFLLPLKPFALNIFILFFLCFRGFIPSRMELWVTPCMTLALMPTLTSVGKKSLTIDGGEDNL